MTDINKKIKEIGETIEKYNFWNKSIFPYNFKMTVKQLYDNWLDYDNCTPCSKGVIESEITGFLPILNKWVEIEKEPKIRIKITEGKNKGEIKEIAESIAEELINCNFAVIA